MAPSSSAGELQTDGSAVLTEIRGLADLVGQMLPAQESRLQDLCEQVAAIARALERQPAGAAWHTMPLASSERDDDRKALRCGIPEPIASRSTKRSQADTKDEDSFSDCDIEEGEAASEGGQAPSVGDAPEAARSAGNEMLKAHFKFSRHEVSVSQLWTDRSTVQRWRETRKYDLLVGLHDKFTKLVEPERTSLLARILSRSAPFFIAVIVSNAFWMAWSANYAIENPREDQPSEFLTIEIAYLSVYTLELVLRLAVHRWYFFCNEDMGWNFADFFVVLYSIMELAFLDDVANRASFLRTLRLLKAGKILRLFRVIRFLQELRVMLMCLLGSIGKFFWSVVMMFLSFYMFSMVFIQGVVSYRSAESDSVEDLIVNDAFGSLQKCLLTLFKMSTGESWVPYYEAMVRVGGTYGLLVIFFVAFSQIALLNVLTGIFVDSAMKNAEPEPEQKAQEKVRETLKLASDLRKLVMQELRLDSDEDLFNLDKLMLRLNGTMLGTYLHYIGVDINEIHHFMNLGADVTGNKFIDTRTFVRACMRVKGSATSLDLQQVLLELKVFRKEQATTLERICDTLGGRRKGNRFERSFGAEDNWYRGHLGMQKSTPTS